MLEEIGTFIHVPVSPLTLNRPCLDSSSLQQMLSCFTLKGVAPRFACQQRRDATWMYHFSDPGTILICPEEDE